MPNLVGIGKNQVPTNAMLGGLAYQDSVGEINLEKIKASTDDTAVDVFVYDTRKDSDGGAWRKRTKNTSWYNEETNAKRGARKEFPAVAIIVAEGTQITIYDGDDPNCSMWMIFNRGTDSEPTMLWDGNNGNQCTSIAAKNGTIMWSTTAAGSYGADFIGERWIYYYNGATYSGFRHNGGGIINRNKAVSSRTVVRQFRGNSGSSAHRDVAMTVRPNAETDPVTKLPIPLIVVGTDRGLEFIGDKHTDTLGGRMRDIVAIRGNHGGSYNQNKFVDFDSKTNAAIFTENYGTGNSLAYKINVHKFPSGSFDTNNTYSDFQEHNRRIQTQGNFTIPKLQGNYIYDVRSAGGNGRFAVRTGDGGSNDPYEGALNIVQEEPGKDWNQTQFPANSRIAYIASDYNSGWLHGDIKRAHLASTNTTSLSADTLRPPDSTLDSTFSTTTGWATQADWTISGGVATCNGNDNGRYFYPTVMSYPIGASVVVELTITAYTSGTLNISFASGNATAGTNMTSTGTYKFVGTNSSNTMVYIMSTSFIGSVDNVKIYIAEHDRSIRKEGLIPYGTITRTPVAPGAELVGYSGWSSSNYLLGNYVDADDDPGSGDYSVIAWAKTSTQHVGIIWSIRNPAASTYWLQLWVNNGIIEFGQQSGRVSVTRDYDDGNWHCYVGVKRNGKILLYFDGLLLGEQTSGTAQDPTLNSNSGIRIGNHHDNNHHFQGSLALVRYSLSGMGADIVEKIYEDEKLLFQENAKCSLYGTSNDVKAMAYDDSKEILHVGTSAGRSDFHRLNRINNTTTAVTHAISASNGLIAEQ